MTLRDHDCAVLVPLKAFGRGKSRLSGVASADRRTQLIKAWAATVLRAAGDLPTAVLTADAAVAEWARAAGATPVAEEGWDFNSSVRAAVGQLARAGVERVVLAHADLPLADDLGWLAEADGIVLVPDRRADGTTVIALPSALDFCFSYGTASSHHHAGEAWRLGFEPQVVRDPLLGWDVDVPEDLALPRGPELAKLREASVRVRQQVAHRTRTTAGGSHL